MIAELCEAFAAGEARDFHGRWRRTVAEITASHGVAGKPDPGLAPPRSTSPAPAKSEQELERAHRLRRKQGLPDARPSTLYPGLMAALIEGATGRLEEKIGHIEKGAFHRWLGKKADEPITDADIQKGLAAGGHPAKMAQFAKAARKFGK